VAATPGLIQLLYTVKNEFGFFRRKKTQSIGRKILGTNSTQI